MSYYLQQELDFIKRTKSIINQYDSLSLFHGEKFEVTLLLNCFVGLLILPQQQWFELLPDEWGIKEEDITFIKQSETKSVKNVATHLRNSISHYRFLAFKDESNEISHVKFEDFDVKRKTKTFEAKIDINSVRFFVTHLSDTLIEKITSTK